MASQLASARSGKTRLPSVIRTCAVHLRRSEHPEIRTLPTGVGPRNPSPHFAEGVCLSTSRGCLPGVFWTWRNRPSHSPPSVSCERHSFRPMRSSHWMTLFTRRVSRCRILNEVLAVDWDWSGRAPRTRTSLRSVGRASECHRGAASHAKASSRCRHQRKRWLSHRSRSRRSPHSRWTARRAPGSMVSRSRRTE